MRNGSYNESDKTEMKLTFAGFEGTEQEKALSSPHEILAWSFGGFYGIDGDKKSPSSYLQSLSLTHYVTDASPIFLKCLVSNRVFKSVVLESSNKSQLVKLVLHDAIITGVSTGGSGGESRLTENIVIAYKSVENLFEDRTKDDSKMVSSGRLDNSDMFPVNNRRY